MLMTKEVLIMLVDVPQSSPDDEFYDENCETARLCPAAPESSHSTSEEELRRRTGRRTVTTLLPAVTAVLLSVSRTRVRVARYTRTRSDAAEESGEAERIVRSGPGRKKGKGGAEVGQRRPGGGRRLAKGAWAARDGSSKKDRGYENFQRYES